MNKVRLEDVCEILDSQRIPITASDRNKGIYPYYGANGIQDYVDDYLFDDELVLLAEDGGNFDSVDKPIAYRVSGKCWVNNHAHVLKAKSDINTDYLCYSLMFYNTGKLVNGATRKKLTQKAMRSMLIPLRSMEEQNKIVLVIKSVFEAIEKFNLINNKLDELIKSRFVEMFGDVKTNSFQWEKCKFGDITTKITDGEHGTVPRVDKNDGYLYFMARNITRDGKIDLTETSYVPSDVHKKIYNRCNPEAGDILLVCVGATIGKNTIVPLDMEEFSMARSVALLKPNREKVNSIFLSNLLKSDPVQSDIITCAHSAAQAGLYTNMIIKLDAFIPPLNIQNKYASFVTKVEKQKETVQKSIEKLETLKKSLMQEYFG